jgi:hypothetical protein
MAFASGLGYCKSDVTTESGRENMGQQMTMIVELNRLTNQRILYDHSR